MKRMMLSLLVIFVTVSMYSLESAGASYSRHDTSSSKQFPKEKHQHQSSDEVKHDDSNVVTIEEAARALRATHPKLSNELKRIARKLKD